MSEKNFLQRVSAKRSLRAKNSYWGKERLLGAGGRTTSDMKPFQAVTRLATTSSSAETGKVSYQKTHLDDAITSIVAPGKLND
jgi:hypothetical protein